LPKDRVLFRGLLHLITLDDRLVRRGRFSTGVALRATTLREAGPRLVAFGAALAPVVPVAHGPQVGVAVVVAGLDVVHIDAGQVQRLPSLIVTVQRCPSRLRMRARRCGQSCGSSPRRSLPVHGRRSSSMRSTSFVRRNRDAEMDASVPRLLFVNIGLRFDVDSVDHQVLVNFGDLHLHPGAGSHGLHLTARVPRHELTGGFLYLQGEATLVCDGPRPRRWLCAWAFTEPILLRPADIETSGQIVLPISDEQLWLVEDIRRGNDFTIELRVNASLVFGGRTYPMINPQQYPLRVDREMWLRQLAGIERMAHFTVAVPAVGDGLSGMASVVRFLREAEAEYRNSRDREAAVALRRAVDRFREIHSIPSEKSFKDVPAQQRDKLQRWANAFHAVLGILNAAPHGDEVTEKIDFDRRDGQALIAMSFALLGRDWK